MSKFVILGFPTDYYHELKEENCVIRYLVDRPMIRCYAQGVQEYHSALMSEGGDIYTSSLDEGDKFNEFIRGEPLDAQTEIYNVLAQETEAIANKLSDQTAALYKQAAKTEANSNYTGQIIGYIVLFFILLVLFFNT